MELAPGQQHRIERGRVIDNREQTERLMATLQAALPLPAQISPELAATLQTKNIAAEIPSTCSITWITYGGDEAGIVCRLDFAHEPQTATFASITHLHLDARLPLARDIAVYKKHRVKRLRRQPA